MPVIFKPIKPKKFKDKEFVKNIENKANKVSKLIEKDYKEGVRTWNTKVDFDVEVIVNPNGGVSITVDTDNQIYFFVHEGTKPHIIKPKKAGGKLRFQGTYTAKTTPGVIKSKPGGSSGEFTYRNIVSHPGTKGRNFTEPIFKKWRPFFEREMQRALDKSVDNTGHKV